MNTGSMRDERTQDKLMRRGKLADQVLQCLMDWIMDGTLQMGDKLYTERISEELGVSRMPVREALNVLERKGIAVSEPYLGTRLIDLRTTEVFEIYRLRQLLEPEAAYEACRKMTPERLEWIRQIHEEYQELMVPDLDAKKVHLKNREFHFAIYSASGMKRNCSMIASLWDTLSFFKLLYGETLLLTAEGQQKMVAEHQSYIDYLAAGEAEALRQAMQVNIKEKLERYKAYLK